jgi:hypothetical protein
MSMIERVMTGLRLAGQTDEMRELALTAEREAHELNGLEPAPRRRDGAPDGADIVEVLRSTCLLLERAPRQAGGAAAAEAVEAAPAPEPAPVADKPPVAKTPAVAAPANGDPSEAITELIAVRDMVAVAAGGDPGAAQATLAALDRKLGRVLAKAGVRALDETGPIDYRYQEVLGFRRTDDPDRDELVCETVRPGYALGERILRPQQVVAYRLED